MKNNKQTTEKSIIQRVLENIPPATKQRVGNRMYIAVKIDDILKEKKMKKKDLAKLLDKSPSEISKWLSGDHNFTIDTLSEIGAALGVNLLQDKISERA